MPLSRNDLKIYSSLHRKSKRLEHGIFIAEGIKVCKELLKTNLLIEHLFINEKTLSLFPDGELISKKDADRISNQKTHSGVFAVVRLPSDSSNINMDKTIIVLDEINDPGNLGSIIRTLDWFGHDQLVCSKNSVDVFNPKTIMASMGSAFRVKTYYVDLQEFLKKYNDRPIVGSTLKGDSLYDHDIVDPSIILLGNESHGLSIETASFVNKSISIPGKGAAESLNVSNSAAIILSELFRKN